MNKVLIIEDDKEIYFMIKDHLEKYNYQVFFTFTGANALERVKELTPDLIILDLMLPFISGDELISVKAKLFCPEIAGLFCRIAGLFCHDSRANLSLKPVCFGIAIS